jgi:hypothetical protein
MLWGRLAEHGQEANAVVALAARALVLEVEDRLSWQQAL